MKKLAAVLILISLSVFFIFSCKKDKTSLNPIDESSSSSSVRTTVTGIVLDEGNAPLNGVTVTAHGQTATTNQYGTFVLKDISVNKDRCVLQFAKAGFFKRLHGFIASANTVNYVRIVLTGNASSQSFSSSAGGTVSLADGSSVLFQSNSFVTSNGSAYNGTVNIAIKHLSPDDANFGFMIPGGDLLGKDLDDKDVALYTYGMLGVELTGSSGEALQLATGTHATLTFTIAASQTATAPVNIPLWYFDETTSLWKEEGAANKVGNSYVGTVKHFTWWNCDYSGPLAYIKGKVKDCQGNLMPNVVVTVMGFYTLTTNQNGEYYDVAPIGMSYNVQVLSSYNGSSILSSQIETIPPLSANQTFIVPDLSVPCNTRVKGNILGCNNELTEGIVVLTQNASTVNFQYTFNGKFNIASPENSSLVLNAYSNYGDSSFQILTLEYPSILDVGNIKLCSSIIAAQPENSFYISGNGFTDSLIVVDTTYGYTTGNWYASSSPYFNIYFGNGSSQPFSNSIDFDVSDTLTGTYYSNSTTNNRIYLIINGSGNNGIYVTDFTGAHGTCVVTQCDIIGGRVKGTFSALLLNTFGQQVVVTNGKFNVSRTQ